MIIAVWKDDNQHLARLGVFFVFSLCYGWVQLLTTVRWECSLSEPIFQVVAHNSIVHVRGTKPTAEAQNCTISGTAIECGPVARAVV